MSDLAERLYEQVLVVRCQAGDGLAFAELVERFGPRLRFFLRRILGPTPDVDDVLQDAWFDVYNALPRLNDPRAFPTWLYRIARDRAFRLLRKDQARIRPTALPESDLVAADGPEVEFGPDEVEAVRLTLDALAPEHRDILILRFLEGMSYEEIAQVVGCPLGTVRSRLHHAKLALRRAFMVRNPHD
jgi:RNA polymerase sigma-70 factor (ECF subfamily)